MGETATFRSEDRAGLAVAVVLHVAVVLLLVFQPVRQEIMSAPQRMTVNLASEVSLEATAPVPASESRAAIAPTLGEEVAPDAEIEPTEAVPETTPETPPATSPRTATAPRTQPTSTARQTTPTTRSTPSPRATNAGGSRVGDLLSWVSGEGLSDRNELAIAAVSDGVKDVANEPVATNAFDR